MKNAVAFDALLDEMGHAALGLSSWDPVLVSISRLLSANSVIIHKELWRGGGWGVRTGGDDRAYSDYFGHYAGIHPLATRTLMMPAGSVYTDRMIMPRAEFEHTAFYDDWARPNQFAEIAHVRLDTNDRGFVGLSLTRPQGGREFSATDLRLACRLGPHLRRAVATYERFESIRQSSDHMIGALDTMRHAVFGLGADGRITFVNETARTMLVAADALRIEDGALAAAHPDQTRALRSTIHSACRGGAPDNLLIERDDGRPPLRLELVHLRQAAHMIDIHPSPMLLLFVHDPEITEAVAAASLRDRYGLTAMEAAVALEAAQGKGLAAAASSLGIGQGTVRSHLKKVFAKAGVNRQAELAWIVARLN